MIVQEEGGSLGGGAGGCQRDLKSADGAESTTTTQMCRYSRTETKGK